MKQLTVAIIATIIMPVMGFAQGHSVSDLVVYNNLIEPSQLAFVADLDSSTLLGGEIEITRSEFEDRFGRMVPSGRSTSIQLSCEFDATLQNYTIHSGSYLSGEISWNSSRRDTIWNKESIWFLPCSAGPA